MTNLRFRSRNFHNDFVYICSTFPANISTTNPLLFDNEFDDESKYDFDYDVYDNFDDDLDDDFRNESDDACITISKNDFE